MDSIYRPRRAPLIALTLLLSVVWGCQTTSPPSPAPPVSVPPEPVVAPAPDPGPTAAEQVADVLDRLAGAVNDYTLALESLLDDGTTDLDAALAAIDELALECASIPECSPEPVTAAYSRVVRMHTAAMATERASHAEELALLTESTREPGTTTFLGEMPELDRSVSLLQGTDLRDLISLNGPVNAALDDWLTWLRPAYIQSYRNYLYLRPEIAPIYEEAGLPEALLFAMIATESRGKVHSTSRAGAAGLLQFMPATGRIYGLRDVDGFDQRFDPVAATRANVGYLNAHFKQFNNSLEKVMAAYNGGEGRMRGIHRRTGQTGFWDERVYYALPRETRDYVPRILAAAWLFLHPEEYGLELPTLDPTPTPLDLVAPIAIDELAICLGQRGNPDGWFRTLRNLNPRYEPGERIQPGEALRVPAEVTDLYAENCIEGDLLARARTLHDANYPPEPRTIPYTVRRGDTLSRIASRHGCADLRSIARMNRISAPRYTIREGQRLRVPACG